MFLINIVLGCLGLIAAARLIPPDTGDPDMRVALTGSALGATMFSLLFGLIQGASDGWTRTPGGPAVHLRQHRLRYGDVH